MYFMKSKKKKKECLLLLFSSQSMLFMFLGFIESKEICHESKSHLDLFYEKKIIYFWVKSVTTISSQPSLGTRRPRLQNPLVRPPRYVYIEENTTILETIHSLIMYIDLCSKTRRKKPTKTKERGGWRRREKMKSKSQNFRRWSNFKCLTRVDFDDFDLMEKLWRRVELGLCGSVCFSLGFWISHFDLIL